MVTRIVESAPDRGVEAERHETFSGDGKIRPFVQGIYMMPACNRYDLVADVLAVVKRP